MPRYGHKKSDDARNNGRGAPPPAAVTELQTDALLRTTRAFRQNKRSAKTPHKRRRGNGALFRAARAAKAPSGAIRVHTRAFTSEAAVKASVGDGGGPRTRMCPRAAAHGQPGLRRPPGRARAHQFEGLELKEENAPPSPRPARAECLAGVGRTVRRRRRTVRTRRDPRAARPQRRLAPRRISRASDPSDRLRRGRRRPRRPPLAIGSFKKRTASLTSPARALRPPPPPHRTI
ncbi:hypothetical protein EVAR_64069_1 [Eumeta japonica]|uniref:Uncharacterized protein n=1 Tax=Eumeta variegata TaxID=151549 RepID=A0A4C1ZES1_EUMVA|nr:hypothetical protein EVAR_64069_1 [Eumeta japonica]